MLELTEYKLSSQEEKFCQYRLEGLSQADAYAKAFGAAHWERKSLGIAGTRLEGRDYIEGRLEELREQASRIAGLSHAWIIERMATEALRAPEAAARIRALENLAKWLNLGIEPKDAADPATMTDEQLDAELAHWYGQFEREGIDLKELTPEGTA